MDDNKAIRQSYNTEGTTKDQLIEQANLTAFAPTMSALPEDPRSFLEAPYSYSMSQNEMVILNNGTLQYSITDFVLPGRNGFDLIMTRRYNSDSAGLYDMNPVSIGANRFRTGRRNNDHNNKMYGLGIGWYFVLPSIEVVPDSEQDRTNFIYPTHLHLEDGRNFEVERDSLKGHPLLDVTIAQTTGTLTHPFRHDIIRPYHTVVSYKNGNRDCFQRINDSRGRLDKFQLVARQDRFGNTICFFLNGSSGMTIVDTWGRDIVLSASGNTMAWALPGHTTGDPRRITYTISDTGARRLVQVSDQLNRVTRYEYHSTDTYRAVSRFASEAQGDTSNEEFPFLLLKRITHPTGALTEYEYGTEQGGAIAPIRLTINRMGGFRQYFPIRARKDISGGSDYYPVSYTYSLAASDEYIKQANVQKLFDITEQHTFNDKKLLTSMEVRHSHILVSTSAYIYGTNSNREDYKLVTSEDTKRYNPLAPTQYHQSQTRWQYTADRRANVARITETYPNDTTLNQETNFLYGAFSILTEKNYRKDDTTTIHIRYTLRTSPDNRVVEFQRIFENTTLKEKTQYLYGTTDNDRYCVTQERRFYTVGGGNLESAGTFHSVNYAYNREKFTHAPIRMEIAGIVDADGNAVRNIAEAFDYDTCGRMTSRTDGNSGTTDITYDALGRVVRETYPAVDGRRDSRATHYNDARNFITTTNENLFKERQEYTPLGQIERVFLAIADERNAGDTLLLECAYDALGRTIGERAYDGNGAAPGNIKATTAYEYDRFSRVISKSIPEVDYSETHEYTDIHTDPDEPARKYFYHQKTIAGATAAAPDLVSAEFIDQLGQVRKAFIGGERTATFGYNKLGNTVSQLDARSIRAAWAYDYAGRATATTQWMNGTAQTASTEYDALGNIRFSRNFTGKQTEFHHDAAGRLIRQVSPFDARRATAKSYYDAAGNLLRQAVNQGEFWREVEYRYDARNRRTDVIQHTSGSTWQRTAFRYDSIGNTTEVRTGYTESSEDYSATEYAYNRFGAVRAITDAKGQAEFFRYDNIGTLTGKTDRNGHSTDYRYDALNRLTKESVTVTNRNGQMTSEREVSYTRTGAILRGVSRETEGGQPPHALAVSYAYNGKGQLVRQTDPDGVSKEYTYDANSNRETFRLFRAGLATPEISLHYAYDDLNRLQRVRTDGASGAVIAEYAYDANGNRTALRYPQGNMETTYAYNDANLITSLENRRNGAVASAWEYRFFLDGNPSSKIDRTAGNRVTTYEYDRIGRLTKESDPGWNTIAYDYDRFSNRSKMAISGADNYETTYEYEPNNLLTGETKRQPHATETLSYRYDANGNQIYREWAKVSREAAERGRMDFRSEERDTPAIIDMREYDGFNQLVKVHRPPMSILYRYLPDGQRHGKAVVNPFSGEVHKTIHHWDGQDIVMDATNDETYARYLRGLGLIAREADDGRNHYFHNMRGDVVQHVDGHDAPMYEYNAFGNERDPAPADLNPFRYCGEYWDAEIQAYYLRARYYNPQNGRWLTEDPAKHGMNWYVYCGNNPISFSDPTGMFAVFAAAARAVSSAVRAASQFTSGSSGGSSGSSGSSGQSSGSSFFSSSSGRASASSGGFGGYYGGGYNTTAEMVIMRTVVERMGGTVSWNSAERSATIRMPGFDPVSGIRGTIVNGNMLVDRSFLMDTFGWSEAQASHRRTDTFRSKYDATLAWGLRYHPRSGPAGRFAYGSEFGSWIYRNQAGEYMFGGSWSFRGENWTLPGFQRSAHETVGWIHTHPRTAENVHEYHRWGVNNFSRQDATWVTNRHDIPGFLVTPSGALMRLDPGWTPTGETFVPSNSGFVSTPISDIFGR